jgi:outer membrane protein
MSSVSTDEKLRRIVVVAAFAAVFALLLAIPMTRADAAPAAEAGSVAAVIDGLVAEALRSNLELEAAGTSVGERLAALDTARARYLPALDFMARYSAADGGRTIEIPVGDLLNPVYSTLNRLTGSTRFPPVANQNINLQRTREQDTRLTLTQPLYDARIGAARAGAAADYDAATANHGALAARIERDMRTAYYRWLQSRTQVAILEAALELASANERVNDSLFRNGKITRDLVYRAEADVLEVEQSLLAARNGERLAQSYVDLLRNVDFSAPLPAASVGDEDLRQLKSALVARVGGGSLALDRLSAVALEQRAELKQLDAQTAAARAGERLARAAFKPQLALAVDAGTQGVGYGLGSEDRYVLASLVLKFNLFSGGADDAGLRGAHERRRAAEVGRGIAEQQIRLEVQQTLQDLEVAEASLGTAAKRVDAAAGAFRIAERKRDLGQINQAEFVDVRRALTDARLNLNVTRFTALGSLAELEFALGAGRRAHSPESQP